MRVVAIVQARMQSSRFEGKVLKDLGGRTMLARVVRRLRRAALVDEVIVATTDRCADNAVVSECGDLDAVVFRGAPDDVLDRYYHAALPHQADIVVRVTSDCPLIDPQVVDEVVGTFLQRRPDYASNVLDRTYPRGLDTEVMSIGALQRAWREAHQPYERVHVTPYIYRHPESFRLASVTSPEDYSRYRWTVDTPADFELISTIYARFGHDDSFSWRDVLRLLDQEPSLADLNCHVRQKSLVEG